jgi:hypothetical protein
MLVEICQKIGGTEYVTGVGALDYLDKSEFEKHGISIIIRDPKKALTEYSCEEQRLSAIDALMKNGKNLKYKIKNLPVTEIKY